MSVLFHFSTSTVNLQNLQKPRNRKAPSFSLSLKVRAEENNPRFHPPRNTRFREPHGFTHRGWPIPHLPHTTFNPLKGLRHSKTKPTRLSARRITIISHALPHYYTLADLKNLSESGPIPTFAGESYTLNFTDALGSVHLTSGWSDIKPVGNGAPQALELHQQEAALFNLFSMAAPYTTCGPNLESNTQIQSQLILKSKPTKFFKFLTKRQELPKLFTSSETPIFHGPDDKISRLNADSDLALNLLNSIPLGNIKRGIWVVESVRTLSKSFQVREDALHIVFTFGWRMG
ncbi:hypothetical protein ACFX1X_003323 [Malus domestica]